MTAPSALPRILLVDDEPNVLSAASRLLRRHFEVHTMTAAADALARLESGDEFAVVVSDFQMPGMNGAQFLTAAYDAAPTTTRMLLTGQADLTDAAAVVNGGQIFRLLLKPVTADVLIDTLHDGVEHHHRIVAQQAFAQRVAAADGDTGDLASDLLTIVSHELRTPVTAIVGLGTTLDTYWDQVDDERRRDFVRRIVQQAAKQAAMVEDLLAVARMRDGGVDPSAEPVVVTAIVDSARARLSDPTVPVAVGGDFAAQVHADPDHCREILAHLLSNAVKYGRSPFEVTLSTDGETTVVEVVDHGDGVPAHFVVRMFDAFAQHSKGNRRTATGLGLGLTVAAALATANGGSIAYDAVAGGGARFRLSLPAHG